ncbi:hypothetical protein [Yoonia sp. 2307UL14-13]|uniref:hypothetical protein n=1 Tax=Yoonia sp. 2307UL14-13 TaxID=3126506 RepID=UPI0030961732
MRQQARRWHRDNPAFMEEALQSMDRCQDAAERDLARRWHTEALDIGFWTKKDVVQYPLACLHAGGSLITVPSFCQYLDQFTEADKDIMQKLLDTAPLHYWTYLKNKTAEGRWTP